jgi:hypothetical protein
MSRPQWPPVTVVRSDDTHRLVPTRHLPTTESLLSGLLGDGASDSDIAALTDLAGATSARLCAQQQPSGGIGPDELVFGVPHWRIINAAFTYAHPAGSRFNGPDRGAWYAGAALDTALAEVTFHKTTELAETDWWHQDADYQDFVSDVHAPLHDLLSADPRALACLDPDSYHASQALAAELLAAGSIGVAYPSVRYDGRDAVACFRPAAVSNVRGEGIWRLRYSGSPAPSVVRIG